jgi:histidinol dehydrogenase
MKTILFPQKFIWNSLCNRPVMKRADLEKEIRDIIKNIRLNGDHAIQDYTLKFDGISIGSLKITPDEISSAEKHIKASLKDAINTAKQNIEKFHSSQLFQEQVIDISEGIKCWRKNVAIDKVGIYIPGGTAPLFSTVLMLAIPANIAGCKKIVMCTPPDKKGQINPVILYAASIAGVTDIFKIGGAQAIAAMAYGTESVPEVYKIFGPGNQYVTRAKELVQQDGIAIDMPAGPSELMVIADKTANSEFVSADLLSQAEHGTDSQVVLLTDNEMIIKMVSDAIERQVRDLSRKETTIKALSNSMLIQLGSIDECIEFCNQYAPEHLILTTADPYALAGKVINAGSVFLGKYSCESTGDYATGTNHTLPTNGFARSFSGVSTESFVKKITFQEVTSDGIKNIGPAVELMAEAEMLDGHKNAVSIRLKSLEND